MPNYKGHLIGGCVAYALVISLIKFPYSLLKYIEFLCFTLLGALFPDIDTKSKGQKIFYKIIIISCFILYFQKKYYQITLIALVSFTPLVVPHRGIFHKLWFIVALLLVIISYSYFYGIYHVIINNSLFFMVGVLSHLWLDLGLKKMLKIR